MACNNLVGEPNQKIGPGPQSNYIKKQPATFTVMFRDYILMIDFRSTSQVSCWRMMRKVVVSDGLEVW